ncbi:MFS transporter [Haliovirga abyssi]|uniref:Protein TsgA n=1 Tax=Haliovirga abyssi TaxID=2996794 RepID=A0AAU9DCW4_9FUSO|nr:MFS transporter [Haliovirga abyssi]BDU50003.1 protein TsgA [Haliovirga abyssi]
MKKIARISYINFLLIGLTFNLLGVSLIYIAKHFSVDTAIIGYQFGFFTIGSTSGIFFTNFLLKKMDMKKIYIFDYVLLIIGILIIGNTLSLDVFRIGLIIYGLGLGGLVSSSNFLIIAGFKENRASILTMANFFYSFGAILSPLIAGYILKININWVWIYRGTILLIIILFYLVIKSDFKFLKDSNEDKSENEEKEKWGITIYLVAFAIFCYVLAEMVFSYWIVTYLKMDTGFKIEIASFGLSLFWIFMAIGRFFSSYIVKKMKIESYIILSAGIGFLGYILISQFNSIILIYVLIAITGLGFSGVYAAVLDFGTKQLRNTSANLMTFIIVSGSFGGIMSSPISSFLKERVSIKYSFFSGAIAILLVLVLIVIAEILQKRRGRNER